jgi:uncharacterized protein YbjT (DUF2867 family)
VFYIHSRNRFWILGYFQGTVRRVERSPDLRSDRLAPPEMICSGPLTTKRVFRSGGGRSLEARRGTVQHPSPTTPAANNGVFHSFLQPLDKPVPMVATADIGHVAAELIQTTWSGRKVVELEGPHRVTPEEIAAAFADVLHRPVQAEAVPRDTWESLFQSEGMKNPTPRIQMLDGFNEGWIEFASGEAGSRKGAVELRTVLQRLIDNI